jgi:thiol-disulfide isomerase/thioredoxin
MTMRVVRHAMIAAGLLGIVPATVSAQITPAQVLERFRPIQKDATVDYDAPTDKAAIEACKVDVVKDAKGAAIGHELRDGQGRLLRRMVDTNGKQTKREGEARPLTHLDRWSYYQNGFEVYRESDLDEDGTLDECRWLNAGGTKIAAIQGNKIVGWRRLSAEEASRLMVHALVTGNARLIETLMATPEELTALGVPPAEVERAEQARAGRVEAINALRKGLVGWGAQTAWQRFDGTMPHVIPADAGLKDDLILYENAFIFVEGDPMKTAYLQAPELIRVGDTWKFAALPRAADPEKPVAAVADTGIRAALFRAGTAPAGPGGGNNPALDEALAKLAEHDKTAPGPEGTKQELAAWHRDRAGILNEDVLKACKTEEERLNYRKQLVDSVAAALQTGLYPEGAGVLDQLASVAGPIGPYAAFRKTLAEYSRDSEEPGANFLQVTKEYLTKLEDFVNKLPNADESADALFQLASINEFNAEEDKAREFYGRLVKEKPQTDPGKKAVGALKRLDLVGKPLDLKGPTLDGKAIDAAQFKGKTLLVAFWTSGADPVKRDLPELQKVYQRYHGKGFEIVGVNLDNDPAELQAFLGQDPLPWPQVFEEGGMDSRLADAFGIISLPTMILVDAEGKVVNRNIRTATELDRLLERMMGGVEAAKRPGDERR